MPWRQSRSLLKAFTEVLNALTPARTLLKAFTEGLNALTPVKIVA
ncbi:hypothetical protein [Gracilibacillus oryzae]|nr:hypothetical protein [Gracilibacillus oryzae]